MINTDILLSDLNVVRKVIDYYAAKLNDSLEWEKIKADAIKNGIKFNSPNFKDFVNFGFLSPLDCNLYLEKNGFGNKIRVVDETINALYDQLIIYPIDKSLTPRFSDERYQLDGGYAYNLYKKGLILNVILGFEYIIKSYNMSVFKIEPTYGDTTKSIGTGFLIEENQKYYVITNKHVIEGASTINMYDANDIPIVFDNLFSNPQKDIAIFSVKENLGKRPFLLNSEVKILDEIITIGYPTVPMTRFAYQLSHKGEINSIVEDYKKNRLIIFSAKTSSGNSGSPVIDRTGRVIGIITEELFEKEAFYTKGKLPYYAAITVREIKETIRLFEKI